MDSAFAMPQAATPVALILVTNQRSHQQREP